MDETTRTAKVSVSGEADALYIRIASSIGDGEATKQESFPLRSRESELILDFSDDGRLLGIEILGIEGLLEPPPRS